MCGSGGGGGGGLSSGCPPLIYPDYVEPEAAFNKSVSALDFE
jgi:hypothetical protein